jgi:hypothetical protein
MERDAPVRLLTLQFFRRFFDNDLVSPHGDGHEHLSTLLAIVAVPGLLATVFLLLQYTSPLLSPGERMLTAIPHKFLLFGCSVCVMALVTCIEWDALSLDARDHAILGPLPLSARAIVTSKLRALAIFAGLFAVATNAIPAVAFPMVFLSTVSIDLGRALWILGVHAAISVLASLFGFVAILGLREAIRLTCGDRVFRYLSAPLQFTAVLGLASALLLLPAIPSNTAMNWVEHRYDVARWVPPLWFVGLEESLTASTILNAPGMDVPSAGRFWSERRDRRARAMYLANAPTFNTLAAIALIASAGCTALAVLVFMAGTRRRREGDVSGASGRGRTPLQPLLARILARHPQRQAGIAFTLQAFARSAEHRLLFAGYLAAGAAATLVLVGPSLSSHAALARDSAPPRLYAVQMILSFFIVAGLRAIFTRPAVLTANWVFQVCWTNDERRYQSGVRRAVAIVLAAFLLALAPLHALWLDAGTLLAHFLVGWLAALTAAEIAVLEPGHIPFTCATVPGAGLKKWWPAYLLAFGSYTFGVAALERLAFQSTKDSAVLVASLAAVYLITMQAKRLVQRRHGAVIFEEQADLTQKLGLEEM